MLAYQLEMGEHEGKIAKMASRMNRPLPERIQNAPDLDFGNELYLSAFINLSTCRQSPYGALPISYFDIIQYATYNNFSQEQIDILLTAVPMMDAEYLKIMERKQKSKNPSKKR